MEENVFYDSIKKSLLLQIDSVLNANKDRSVYIIDTRIIGVAPQPSFIMNPNYMMFKVYDGIASFIPYEKVEFGVAGVNLNFANGFSKLMMLKQWTINFYDQYTIEPCKGVYITAKLASLKKIIMKEFTKTKLELLKMPHQLNENYCQLLSSKWHTRTDALRIMKNNMYAYLKSYWNEEQN